MVTIINSHKDTINSNWGVRLLLDRLSSILNSTGHTNSIYCDMFKYVHEKPACHNICEKSTAAKCANYKKRLRQKLMTNTKITEGGKSFVC